MTHRRFVTTAGIALGAVLCSPVLAEDSLDRRMRALSPEARDCGRTEPTAADRGSVLRCVKAEVEAGTPFRARFDGTCVDSICAWGVLREKQAGPIRLVPFDPASCNPANDTDVWCGTFAEAPCKDPKVIVSGKKLRVVCEDYVF